ncbi:Hcm1 protein [Maudiozyma humilis]|uniref:Hcm1 protein n=1 Tax=Maudiozyma humilis TaxID=51915 RepID=A0AAV5S5R6_MAUHU|nr:Hcm1 protein [Kazachstania humilis]
MEGDTTPSYHAVLAGSSPFTGSVPAKRLASDTFGFDASTRDNDPIITPPSSTIRKSKTLMARGKDDGKEPLSPIQSSPIAPTAKRQRSEGCPRSNGNLSLDEILASLEKRKLNNELDRKPPYSYAILICLAILQSPEGKLTLSQIYNWISTHFSFYKPKDASWQNSIRHNLSLNEAFIKTEKSYDGKGHYWEVKPMSMPKFFKGDTDGYDTIRVKVANIQQYFHADGSDSEGSASLASTPTPGMDSTAQVIPTIAAPSITFTSATDESPTRSKGHGGALHNHPDSLPLRNSAKPAYSMSYADISRAEMTNMTLSNTAMKRNHTSLGFDSTSENFLTAAPREYYSFNEYSGNHTLSAANIHTLGSPQNAKRYIGSFNSSFDELSPRPFRSDPPTQSGADGLLGPFANSPLPPSNPDKLTQLLPSSTHHNISHVETEQLNLLKTPELKRSHSLERTPNRFIATPKDNDSLLKKWQTPSHLFEDIYSSPIFKAMGSASKVSATPGGSTLLKKFSPSKANSDANNDPIKSKLACGGLFGVDVYSVWQRATDRRSSSGIDEQLERPFESRPDAKK